VPVPPGGVADPIARILADHLTVALGQPVVVENVTGAGGSIGVGRAARAAPDGYTISIGNWLSHVGASAVYPVQYDVLRDFAAVSLLTNSPMLITARKDFPANDLKELIAWLKANPNKATAATVGVGSAAHVSGVYFQRATDTRFQFVPYRGGGPRGPGRGRRPCRPDVQRGNRRAPLCAQPSDQDLRGVGQNPWFAAPDVPTSDEPACRASTISFWHGLLGAHGHAARVVNKLNGRAGPPPRSPMRRCASGSPISYREIVPATSRRTEALHRAFTRPRRRDP
jgi:hypothetical protein